MRLSVAVPSPADRTSASSYHVVDKGVCVNVFVCVCVKGGGGVLSVMDDVGNPQQFQMLKGVGGGSLRRVLYVGLVLAVYACMIFKALVFKDLKKKKI